MPSTSTTRTLRTTWRVSRSSSSCATCEAFRSIRRPSRAQPGSRSKVMMRSCRACVTCAAALPGRQAMARNLRPGSARAGRNRPRRLRGFTYLGILIAVAFLGIGLAAIGTVWATTAQREREAQLLFAGDAYRAAIEGYYRSGPVAQQLPKELDELLNDARGPLVRHHL